MYPPIDLIWKACLTRACMGRMEITKLFSPLHTHIPTTHTLPSKRLTWLFISLRQLITVIVSLCAWLILFLYYYAHELGRSAFEALFFWKEKERESPENSFGVWRKHCCLPRASCSAARRHPRPRAAPNTNKRHRVSRRHAAGWSFWRLDDLRTRGVPGRLRRQPLRSATARVVMRHDPSGFFTA